MNIDKKRASLENFKKKLSSMRQKEKRLLWEEGVLKKKLRIRKLIQAGLIFEEAGILDNYIHDEVLELLKNLKGVES